MYRLRKEGWFGPFARSGNHVRLLIDENLPLGLAAGCGVEALHATQLGKRPSDSELWVKAAENDCILVTKDADFFDRLVLHGPPPKVVWVRVGNIRRRDLEALFKKNWRQIERLLLEADMVELFSNRIEAIRF